MAFSVVPVIWLCEFNVVWGKTGFRGALSGWWFNGPWNEMSKILKREPMALELFGFIDDKVPFQIVSNKMHMQLSYNLS